MGSRFGSLEMMWQQNRIVREFVFSSRLARLAAELLGVPAVRLYHDNGLSKQPGCGRTPWHYDAHHFPIATKNVCTVWAPLQEIPDVKGPLGFAKGIAIWELIKDIPFIDYQLLAEELARGEIFRELQRQFGSTVRLLDVACGSGQFPAALMRAGGLQQAEGLTVEYALLDPSEFSLCTARRQLAPPRGIPRVLLQGPRPGRAGRVLPGGVGHSRALPCSATGTRCSHRADVGGL